jgi:hypothetical protein
MASRLFAISALCFQCNYWSAHELLAASRPQGGEELRVTIIYFGPGDPLLTRFGHAALWIADSITGRNDAYNFGVSDTRRPGFYLDLLRSEVLSHGIVRDAKEMLSTFPLLDRSMWLQELSLTPAQRLRLSELLDHEIHGRTPLYRQDFLHANCTTKLRDILDLVLDGQIRAATESLDASGTYRENILRYVADDLLLHAGLLLGLGRTVDQPISAWDEMFLPDRMREHLRTLEVYQNNSSQPVRLVQNEEVWFLSQRDVATFGLPTWHWPRYLSFGLLTSLGVLLLSLTPNRLGLGLLSVAVWSFGTGILGIGLLALAATSGQQITHWNLNVLIFNPLGILLAERLLAGVAGAPRAPSHAQLLSMVIVLTGAGAAGIAAFSDFRQAIMPVVVAIMPTHVAVLYTMRGHPLSSAAGEVYPERIRDAKSATASNA